MSFNISLKIIIDIAFNIPFKVGMAMAVNSVTFQMHSWLLFAFLGVLWVVLEKLLPSKATRALPAVQPFLLQNYYFVRPMLSYIQKQVHPYLAMQSLREFECSGWLLYFF